ncbi:hypothetical protein [Nonomuraea sp. NPDC049709]|uniref:hypothetical protein n=1 Tax=Nonomuraea sp. NPDC049709 TaxID=3154736 RepID=UPI0034195D8C
MVRRCRSPKISSRSVHSVRAVRTHRSAKCIRARRPRWDLQHVNVVAGEDLIEAAGELRVPILDQEPGRAGTVRQIGEKITGLLGNPCTLRVGGRAEHVHEPGADLHHEEDVQPAQRDGVHREEITSQRARGMGAQEVTPRSSARRGAGTSRARFRNRRIVALLTRWPRCRSSLSAKVC